MHISFWQLTLHSIHYIKQDQSQRGQGKYLPKSPTRLVSCKVCIREFEINQIVGVPCPETEETKDDSHRLVIAPGHESEESKETPLYKKREIQNQTSQPQEGLIISRLVM